MNRGLSLSLFGVVVAAAIALGVWQQRLTSDGKTNDGGPDRSVPPSLQSIEADSEDIIDVVPSGDWVSVEADVSSISGAWTEYLPRAAGDGAPRPLTDSLAAGLEHLQASASVQDVAGTMQAANDVSAAVIELFELYHPVVPPDIGRLDVLGRQVVLDAAANDLSAARETLVSQDEVWARVKLIALRQGGTKAAANFDDCLAAQHRALEGADVAALSNEASRGLEVVDVLEGVFPL